MAAAAAAASGEQVAECVGRWVWYGHYVDRRSTGGPQKMVTDEKYFMQMVMGEWSVIDGLVGCEQVVVLIVYRLLRQRVCSKPAGDFVGGSVCDGSVGPETMNMVEYGRMWVVLSHQVVLCSK